MEQNEIEEYMAAYRKGATADFIRPKIDGKWGAFWTFSPCDPSAAERMGRQLARMGATEAVWVRRARVRDGAETRELIIITDLPSNCQRVIEISTGVPVLVAMFLADASTNALSRVFQV